jgi:XTP/dITP diphosphohydrolase
MQEIVIASANKKKLAELKELLPEFSILTLEDVGFNQIIEEPFFTFHENAYAKAKAIHDVIGKMVLADDSGICVNALNGAPGVLSARYSGEAATDKSNLDFLLYNMKSSSDRSAYYIAVVCLVLEDGSVQYFEGKCFGTLLTEPQGENGFGYDPIFVPDGFANSFGVLDVEVKKRISHRSKAMMELKTYLSRK